jgi:hypothetical protein
VVITVLAVRMVQVTVHQIIDVIAVRHRLMSAVWSVNMVLRMPCRAVSAPIRVLRVHFNNVFTDLVTLDVLQVALGKVVRVPVMFHGQVATARTMDVLGPIVLSGLIIRVRLHNVISVSLPTTTIRPRNQTRSKHSICKSLAFLSLVRLRNFCLTPGA